MSRTIPRALAAWPIGIVLACGSTAVSPPEPGDAAEDAGVDDASERSEGGARFDAEATDGAFVDAAPAPSYCATLTPAPRFCADFDGDDPWAGWESEPVTRPMPLRAGTRVGVTSVGVSSAPRAFETRLPPHPENSRTALQVKPDFRVTQQVSLAFDFTLHSDVSPGAMPAWLAVVSFDDGTPMLKTEVQMHVGFPSASGVAELELEYFHHVDATGEERSEIVPLGPQVRVGVRTRWELVLTKGASVRDVVLEVWADRTATSPGRLVHRSVRDDARFEGRVLGRIGPVLEPDSPAFEGVYDDVVFDVK